MWENQNFISKINASPFFFFSVWGILRNLHTICMLQQFGIFILISDGSDVFIIAWKIAGNK